MTSVASGPNRFATSSMAQTAVPPEPPTSSPSSRASRRAVRKESRSETVTYSSTRDESYVVGQKSSPIPSTRYGWTLDGCEKMEPSGSAPTTRRSGFRSRRYRAVPEIVPPVPTEKTIASSSPSVCSQISGPVVS